MNAYKTEFEVRFLAIDVTAIRKVLKSIGAELISKEYLMRRQVFDIPESNNGKWLRLRDNNGKIEVTIKHQTESSLTGMKELQFHSDSDFETMQTFVNELGLEAGPYQENKRELWTYSGVEITIDTWPGLKPVLELDGPDEKSVKSVAEDMGLSMDEATHGSIISAYKSERGTSAEKFQAIENLTFENPDIDSLL